MPSVRSVALLVAAACLLAGFTPAASAQAGSAALANAVADLASGDRDKVVAGRTALLAQMNGFVKTNPAGLAPFAKDLNAQLMPIASGNDPHAKLNAAIVVLRVTEQLASPDLAPLIVKFIGDSSPAVAGYGLRAASNVLPRMLTAKEGENTPFGPAILAAVAAHPDSEVVAIESYLVIVRVLNDREVVKMLTAGGVDTATPRAVDAVLKLLNVRIAQYGKGTLVEPSAEQPAALFLGKSKTYDLSSPAQRTATIRTLLQLIDAAGAEMAEVNKVNSPTARLRMTDLRSLIRTIAGSLTVISDLSQKPDLKTLAQKASQLGNATPVAEYRQVIAELAAAFYKEMPDTRPPSTQPATAP